MKYKPIYVLNVAYQIAHPVVSSDPISSIALGLFVVVPWLPPLTRLSFRISFRVCELEV